MRTASELVPYFSRLLDDEPELPLDDEDDELLEEEEDDEEDNENGKNAAAGKE